MTIVDSNSRALVTRAVHGTSNGTFIVANYDPSLPVANWHQNMEFATICISLPLSLIVLSTRLTYRWFWLHRFKKDDRWMAAAGVMLLGYTICQIGANRFGGGLLSGNVKTSWRPHYQYFKIGFGLLYTILPLIKISVCVALLEIIPHHRSRLRHTVFGIITIIGILGLFMTLVWLFGCVPLADIYNYNWALTHIDVATCLDFVNLRWVWIASSIVVDLLISAIPLQILRQITLPKREGRIIRLVFGANILGTFASIAGIYGVWSFSGPRLNNAFYYRTPLIMLNDVEILVYIVVATLPVFSRHLVSKARPSTPQPPNFSDWARNVPDLFRSGTRQADIAAKVNRSGSHVADDPGDIMVPVEQADRDAGDEEIAIGILDSTAQSEDEGKRVETLVSRVESMTNEK